MNRLDSLQDVPSETMERTVSPEIAPEAHHPTVLDRPPEPAINPLAPPSRKVHWIVSSVAAMIAIGGLTFCFRHDAKMLFNQFLPYSSATAFVVIGLIGVFYKDKDKYVHPVAAWAVVFSMITFGFLMGLNTSRERDAAQKQKQNTDKALLALSDGLAQARQDNAEDGKVKTKSLDKIAEDLQDFKNTVRVDELRGDMSGLKSTMEKVLNPPKADLLFTFAPFPQPPHDGDRAVAPVLYVTRPIKEDGSVEIRFSLVNNTSVPADDSQVSVEICQGCKFTKEPARFTKLQGDPDTVRNHVYGDMPAGAPFYELVIDVTPPPNASAFNIQVSHRCKTCVLRRTGTVGTVHIQRN